MRGLDATAGKTFFDSLRDQAGESATGVAKRLLDWVRRFALVHLDFGKGSSIAARPVIRTGGAGAKMGGYPKPFVIRTTGQIEINFKAFALNRPAFPRRQYLLLLARAGLVPAAATADRALSFNISLLDDDARFLAFQEAVDFCVTTLSETEG